jgi:type I restriction enzyme M protein
VNEQTLFRLRDILRSTVLTHDDASLVILLLLVWARQASPGQDISPQQLVKELEHLADSHPVLARAFFDRGLLRQVTPATLALAVEVVQSAGSEKAAADAAPVDLPHLLGLTFACDPSLPALLGMLVGAMPGELVYLPWDDTGQLGAALAAHGAQVVTETPSPTVIAMLISMLHSRQWRIEQVNPITERGTSERPDPLYETAAAILPLGLRIDPQWLDRAVPGRFPERTSSAAVLGVRQLLAVTRTRIVVAVQNSLLFSSGAENNLREDLLRRGLLRAVVALPGGLLSGTSIALSVMVIDLCGGIDTVRFVNADTPRFKTAVSRTRTTLIKPRAIADLCFSKTDEPDAVSVTVQDLLKNGAQLQVNRYVLPATIARAQAILASAKTVRLEEVADFFRAPPITGEADASTVEDLGDDSALPIFEIGASDLPEFSYVTRPGRRVVIDPKARADAQVLCPNDIVLVVKGSVGKVGIVSGDDEPEEACAWIAGQSAIVLRVREGSRIDPRALFMQLRSPLGQQLLKGIVSGATIPLIQLKELRKLPVILPDAATQQRAIDALEAEAVLARQIHQLREEQAFQASSLWQLT